MDSPRRETEALPLLPTGPMGLATPKDDGENRITRAGRMNRKIYLRLEGELAEAFKQIKRNLMVKNDTEVLRLIINWYYKENKEKFEPRLKYLTLNSEGAMILDQDLDRVIQVSFKPEGSWCKHCKTGECIHTQFVLAHPKIQKGL